jgi:hypothetical protein
MSKELEDAFKELGLDLEPGKTAINGKKWGPNEPGETESISKALNPPSIGAKPGAVAKTGKARNWGFLIKAAIAALVVIAILVVLYKYRDSLTSPKITEVFESSKKKFTEYVESGKQKLEEVFDNIKNRIAELRKKNGGSGDAPNPAPADATKFGSDDVLALLNDAQLDTYRLATVRLMIPSVGELHAMIKGGTRVYGLDGVRVDVLYGLLCAAEKDAAIGGADARTLRSAIVESFTKVYKKFLALAKEAAIGQELTLEAARKIVDEWLAALAAECPIELRRVLGELTDPRSAFAGSAENDESKNPRVLEIYGLLQKLSAFKPGVEGAAAFGADTGDAKKKKGQMPKKKEVCSYVEDDGKRCQTECGTAEGWQRSSACVCEVHKQALITTYGSNDQPIVLLLTRLRQQIADHPGTEKIADALAELERAALWNDPSYAVVAESLASRGTEFGTKYVQGAASMVYNVSAAAANAAFDAAAATGNAVLATGNALASAPAAAADLAYQTTAATWNAGKSAVNWVAGGQPVQSEDQEAAQSGPASDVTSVASSAPSDATSDGTAIPSSWRTVSPKRIFTRKQKREELKKTRDAENPAARIREETQEDGTIKTTRQEDWVEANKNRRKEDKKTRDAAKEAKEPKAAKSDETRMRKFASVDDFLAKGKGILSADVYEDMRLRFEDKKRARESLLAELKRKQDPTFIRALEEYLALVPVNEYSLDQFKRTGRRLAERLVVYRASDVEVMTVYRGKDVETIEAMKALAVLQSCERRVSHAAEGGAAVPVPFSTAVRRHLEAAKAMDKVVPEEKKKRFLELVDDVTLALKDREEDAIKNANDNLIAFVKACVVPKAAFGKRGGKKKDTVKSEDRSADKRWRNLIQSRAFDLAGANVPIVFTTCIPSSDDEFDMDSALASLRKFVASASKDVSLVDQITQPPNPQPGFGMNPRDLAQKVGAEGYYDAATGAASAIYEGAKVFVAVKAAARVGEAVILEMLKLLLDGAYLLYDVVNGTTTPNASEAWVRSLVATDQQKQAERDVRAFTADIDVNRKLQKDIRGLERKLKDATLETAFGMDPSLVDKLDPSPVGPPVPKPMAEGSAVTTAAQGAPNDPKQTSNWFLQRVGSINSKGAKEAVVKFFKSTGLVLWNFINSIASAIWETFDTGNVFDLFENVASKIKAFFVAQKSDTNSTMYDKLIGFFQKFQRAETILAFGVYFEGLIEWYNKPDKIRGLFTDPAGGLVGDEHQKSRDLLRDARFAKVARAGVISLFVLRLLQLIKRVATGSIVHKLVCDAAKGFIDYESDIGAIQSVTEFLGEGMKKLVGCDSKSDLADLETRKAKLAAELAKAEADAKARKAKGADSAV